MALCKSLNTNLRIMLHSIYYRTAVNLHRPNTVAEAAHQ